MANHHWEDRLRRRLLKRVRRAQKESMQKTSRIIPMIAITDNQEDLQGGRLERVGDARRKSMQGTMRTISTTVIDRPSSRGSIRKKKHEKRVRRVKKQSTHMTS